MFNRLFFLFCFLFLITLQLQAQTRAIMPFTGIRYFSEGITAKSIEVRVDGALLLNNRIPLNKEFEIKLLSAAGLTADGTKNIFPAAELNIVSQGGQVLGTIPNILKEYEAKGLPIAGMKDIAVKLTLKPEQLKAEPACIVKIRFYDLKGKNQLRTEFPVTIARPGEALQLSKQVNEVKSSDNTLAKSVGVKIKQVSSSIDTSIRVAPKMAYASLDMSGIEGSSITEMMSGKESYWVYDENLNEVKISERQLKQVSGAMENNTVNYLSKIPYRLKTITGKLYTVRFRWESADKWKVIDIVLVK